MKTKSSSRIIILTAMILAAIVLPALAAPPPYYVAGDFNGWNAAGNLMTETYAGSGIWQVSLNMSTGRHEFKITEGDWAWAWPGANSWLYADGSGNVTITFDSNTYADGWSDSWGRVGVNVDPGTWTAVGDWQGWDNASSGTAMPPEGGGIYGLQYFIASPGNYQYKAVDSGSWDAIGADARSVNASTLYFTTAYPNQPVVFSVNATNGTIKTDVLPPLPCIGTNSVKFCLLPQLNQGFDVKDSRDGIVLADDFLCTNSGPITDIHVWSSWLNDTPGTITNWWIGIYSDVPAGTNYLNGQVTNSHPGSLLWWTNFPQGGLVMQGIYTNYSYEYFYNPTNNLGMGNDTVIWYYCFFPTKPFVQQGSPNAPTNYWLAIRAQLAPDGTLYGWKSSALPYHDAAVWGTFAGSFPGGTWHSMTNPMTLQPLNLSMLLTTSNAPSQTGCCPETNTIKWVQPPNLINGADVLASLYPTNPCDPNFGWVVADDFPCTNNGYIADIHIWGAWLNDLVDPNATFTLAIWSDVPTNATYPFSHPGVPLWSQTYGPGQYDYCLLTKISEIFSDPWAGPMPPNCDSPAFTTNLYHLCFSVPPPSNLTNTFFQTGSVTRPTNYWLSVTVQGTNYFGWKSSATNYNDYAVGSSGGSFFPTNWDVPFIIDPYGDKLNMAFMIGMGTNQCTTPPQLQPTYLTVNCADLSWSPPSPGIVDPCCPSGSGTLSMLPGPFVISNCPTIYQYNWAYTNCQLQIAFGSSYVTVTSAAPVLLPTNYFINCGSPMPTNAPGLMDACCSNIIPVWQNSVTNNGVCKLVVTQYWKAVDCNCTNLWATCTQTITVTDTNPPILSNCGTNMSVLWPNPWSFTVPTAQYVCSGSNAPVGILSSNVIILNSCSSSNIIVWAATNQCSGAYSICTQVVTVVCTACVESNGTKYVQMPNVYGWDVGTTARGCWRTISFARTPAPSPTFTSGVRGSTIRLAEIP